MSTNKSKLEINNLPDTQGQADTQETCQSIKLVLKTLYILW